MSSCCSIASAAGLRVEPASCAHDLSMWMFAFVVLAPDAEPDVASIVVIGKRPRAITSYIETVRRS